jgi:hypothetical protein
LLYLLLYAQHFQCGHFICIQVLKTPIFERKSTKE